LGFVSWQDWLSANACRRAPRLQMHDSMTELGQAPEQVSLLV
jgi:hypothetical protein